MDPKQSVDSGSSSDLLFVNSTGSGRARDAATKRQIRQHVMRDIGRARRKPPRNPQVKLRVRSVPSAAEPPSSSSSSSSSPTSAIHPADQDETDTASTQLIPFLQPQLPSQSQQQQQPQHAGESSQLPPVARPFWDQHPLAVMEKSWGMDAFAAYGLALAVAWDQSMRNSCKSRFWFPFAFKDSGFCRKLLTGPEVRAAVRSQTMERSINFALARSIDIMACIEVKLRSPDMNRALANGVIQGVIGCICYNYIVADLDQARIHLDGLKLIITKRGGIESLSDDQDLVMMVFWIDTIASLLFEQRPRFPIPPQLLITPIVPRNPPEILTNLPFYLSTLCPNLDAHQLAVVSALQDIGSLAESVQSKLAARGDDLWKEEIFLGTMLNPIAYRLLDTPPHPHPDMPCTFIEALRLGALLWILRVKHMAQAYPGTPDKYVTKMLRLLQNNSISNLISASAFFIPFQLWLLLLCATMTTAPNERADSLKMTARMMNEYGWGWQDVMLHVKQLPWITGFEAQAPFLASEVQLLQSTI
ncbi:hypothetical protein V8C35DRAFT_195862 [Trichoderma chlorosporum]